MHRAVRGSSVLFRRVLLLRPNPFTNFTQRITVNKSMCVRLFSDDSRHRPNPGGPLKNREFQTKEKEKVKALREKMETAQMESANAQTSRHDASPDRPLYFTGTLGKYTHSLFDSAVKANLAERVDTELQNLLKTFNSNADLHSQLLSPIIRKDQKSQIAQRWASGSSEFVIRSIERMVNEDQIRDFPTIVSNYSRLLAEKLGHINAVVCSAQPLTPKQLQKIEKNMSQLLKPGQKFVLSTQLMPKLLGGLKIRIGDRELDLSVSSKIMQFEQVFRAALGQR